MVERYDCIVIGAGFSGLAAATGVKRAGRAVKVLEARDRVGGRTEAGSIEGTTIDLGGMWLGPNQSRLMALAQSWQVRTYPTWLDGRGIVRVAGVNGFIDGDALDDALPEAALASLGRVFGSIAAISDGLDPAAPWNHVDAHLHDARTVASWLDELDPHPATRDLVTLVCQSLFCAEPGQVSLLFFLFYLAGGGGIDVLISAAEGGAQNLLCHGGVHQLAVRLADELGDAVMLSAPVRSVRWESGRVVVETADDRLESSRLVVALPPSMIQKIDFEPSLPHAKKALIARQPMGTCIKVWIAYQHAFWRDAGMNGFVLDVGCPVTPFMDVTPPGDGPALLSGFFDADAAVAAAGQTPAQRKAVVLAALERCFGARAATPLEYVERDWTAERWSDGCYGAYMGPGTLTTYGHALRDPIGPIHWAGTESATEWAGYIEGALQSGERAAAEVIAELGSMLEPTNEFEQQD